MPAETTTSPLFIVTAAALIRGDGRILVQRRPEGKAMAGLWEFPGGKLESGETPVACLVRELREELAIEVHPSCLTPFCFASEPLGARSLLLLLYLCDRWTGDPAPQDGQALRWADLEELRELPMPPADRPLVEALGLRTPSPSS